MMTVLQQQTSFRLRRPCTQSPVFILSASVPEHTPELHRHWVATRGFPGTAPTRDGEEGTARRRRAGPRRRSGMRVVALMAGIWKGACIIGVGFGCIIGCTIGLPTPYISSGSNLGKHAPTLTPRDAAWERTLSTRLGLWRMIALAATRRGGLAWIGAPVPN